MIVHRHAEVKVGVKMTQRAGCMDNTSNSLRDSPHLCGLTVDHLLVRLRDTTDAADHSWTLNDTKVLFV